MKHLDTLMECCKKIAAFKWLPLIFFVSYRLVLDWTYVFFLVPIYGTTEFAYNPSFMSWLISIAVAIIVFFLIYDDKATPSNFVLSMFLIVSYVPLSTYFAFSGRSPLYFLYVSFCWVLIKLIINFSFKKELKFDWRKWMRPFIAIMESIKKRGTSVSKFLHIFILVFCLANTVGFVVGTLLYRDLSGWLALFDLGRVYEIRQDIVTPLWFGYVEVWQVFAINLFLTAYFIFIKKYPLASIPLILQLLHYFTTGVRASLFAIPFFIVFLILSNFFKRPTLPLSASIGAGIAFTNVLVVFFRFGLTIFSLLVMRTIFMPVQIEYGYFEFFQEFPKLVFSEGRIGSLLGTVSPYPLSSHQMLTMTLYGTVNSNTNTGFFAAAFSDLGFAGMVLVAVLLAVVLKYCDVCFKKLPLFILIPAIITPFFIMTNGSFFTVMLTNGLGVQLFLFTLLALAVSLKQNDSETPTEEGD